jgi:putative endonuclease
MAAHNELGIWGEEVAVGYLQDHGYVILERDWHSGHHDIDIVAVDRDVVVFVEVKTRRNRLYAAPEQAVDYRKVRALQSAANHYVKFKRINLEVRFDIITVVGTRDGEPEISHIKDAF